MSDVTGLISTLPGAAHQVPSAAMCDTHPDRPAIARIQGETDSFGCEMIDCCEECRQELLAKIKAAREGVCDWCGNTAKDLRDHRDSEEGFYGPVYRVCGACILAEAKRYQEGDYW